MGEAHFKDTGMDSFFGAYVYEQVVPRDHFLVLLNQLIDWDALVPIFLPAYEGQAEVGNRPYSPSMIFKMLLISYLYNISERQTEEWVNYYLPAKEFVGLGVVQAAPDHSTLCLFKRRLEQAGRWQHFQTAADQVLWQARGQGIRMGAIQVVDSVHTVADVDNEADRQRQNDGKPPRDGQAQLVKKGKRRRTEPDGSQVTKEVLYRGYKTHVSLNAETGLITSLIPTGGSAADNRQFEALLAHDEAQGVGATIYAGDKAYDDIGCHGALIEAGKQAALRLHAYRTQKKNPHKEPWLRILASEAYEQGLRERFKIERKFGEAKRWHGLRRCRSLGLLRFGIQAHLTALALNVKRIVLLLTGVHFRAPARKLAVAM
jgi:transposase, IS5 family